MCLTGPEWISIAAFKSSATQKTRELLVPRGQIDTCPSADNQ